MSMERCTNCGNQTDTDYNVEGEYIEDENGKLEYYCEDCVIDEENKETKQ